MPIVYAWTRELEFSPLWEIVYYSDTCIVYLAVRETEYFTEILRNIRRMREQWCPGRFFPPPQKNGLGTRLGHILTVCPCLLLGPVGALEPLTGAAGFICLFSLTSRSSGGITIGGRVSSQLQETTVSDLFATARTVALIRVYDVARGGLAVQQRSSRDD